MKIVFWGTPKYAAENLTSIVKIEDEQVVTHQGISPHVWVDNISITGEA